MTLKRAKERALTCTHVIKWIKKNHREWLRSYLSDKSNGYKSLLRLLQRFSHRHGFSRQRPGKLKLKQDVLVSIRDEFAADFHRQYEAYDDCSRYNWSIRGGDAKIFAGEKNAYHMTAVLTIRGDGKKLPLMFIIRGKPGGRIATNELPTYPPGHFYAVQEKAWMDSVVWRQYLVDVLEQDIEGPSVVMLDNFEPHVSVSSYKAINDMGCHVCALPPNSTSVYQPLDVGIMAPFKRHMRDIWLDEDDIDDDETEDLESPTATKKRLALINRSILAWGRITDDEICRSFEKVLQQ
ncbi:hypothetical protein LEN26_002467 [Aphanomyces euteiches]|nr:hypothetical protein AeMF1_014679 [Aphanomyces euteiches]KAH9159190.1 hypothetical protein LEN26_002467 [Aphanomyces euteiches]KAH9167254.1 hypothetical protein AeNC1_018191 [Aphanomyces euteiches]